MEKRKSTLWTTWTIYNMLRSYNRGNHVAQKFHFKNFISIAKIKRRWKSRLVRQSEIKSIQIATRDTVTELVSNVIVRWMTGRCMPTRIFRNLRQENDTLVQPRGWSNETPGIPVNVQIEAMLFNVFKVENDNKISINKCKLSKLMC